ncbi:MAG: glycosyltransferase family 4 protein [bacterium]
MRINKGPTEGKKTAKKKIVIIGPAYPFRGGISHYNTLLYRALKRIHNVAFFSFKRQYPDWLFPGKSDREPDEHTTKEPDIEYLLDSLNPLTWFGLFFRIMRERPRLLIIPWWTAFWAPQFFTLAFLVRRFTSIEILFICHNVTPHDSAWLHRLSSIFVLINGHYYIVQSEDDRRILSDLVRKPLSHIIKNYHPTYEFFNLEHVDRDEARDTLGLKGTVLLFFGLIREYKGLMYLIEALPSILSAADVTLLIAGEFWEDKDEYTELIKRLGIEDHVKIIDAYIPNEEVQIYFSAADICIMPYISATGSGVAQIAYGFNLPVIATSVGCLKEIIEDGVTGFLVPPRDPDELAKKVIETIKGDLTGEFRKNIEKIKDRFSWDGLVRKIDDILSENDSNIE